MSKYIKKDENGFYVFDEIEFSKTLPTGLEYFAVDKETEQIYNLGFNYKEKMEKQIADLEAKLAEKSEQIKELTECNQYLQIYRNQDKISFAVEKLQEAKMLLEEKYSYDVEESDFAVVYEDDIDKIFDNQIKLLKEMKYDGKSTL